MTTLIASQHATDLKLSLLASEIGRLLAEAKELQGGGIMDNFRQQGEMLVRMQAPGYVEKAAKVAERTIADGIKCRADEVIADWSTTSVNLKWFAEDRVADVVRATNGLGELATIAFWQACREPQRFCACGGRVPCEAHR